MANANIEIAEQQEKLEQDVACSDNVDCGDDDLFVPLVELDLLSILKDSQQYKLLKKTLTDNGWSVSAENEPGFLKVDNGDLNYMLYLFFGDNKNCAYIASEAMVGEEPPLWFTVDSCVKSPIYMLEDYVAAREKEIREMGCFQNPYYKIVVMMESNYIINAENQIDEWSWISAISCESFIELVNRGGSLSFSSDYKDLGGLKEFY